MIQYTIILPGRYVYTIIQLNNYVPWNNKSVKTFEWMLPKSFIAGKSKSKLQGVAYKDGPEHVFSLLDGPE